MANRNLSCVILLGGLSVNLNHLTNSDNVVELILYNACTKLYRNLTTEKSEL